MVLVSKDVEFSYASFDICEKFVASCPPTRTPTQKLKKVYFYSEFPGNWFEFGIIEIDFSSSTIRAIQIHDSFAGFKNPKNPGI